MVIPAVTSARSQHDAGRDNSVHDHFECVHKTFLKKPAFDHFTRAWVKNICHLLKRPGKPNS